MSNAFRAWFCAERPHQGTACGNQPPLAAFPTLSTLPPVVDPDGWVAVIDGFAYVRTTPMWGALAKQTVTIQVAAPTGEFVVFHFAEMVAQLCQATDRAEQRLRSRQRRPRRRQQPWPR